MAAITWQAGRCDQEALWGQWFCQLLSWHVFFEGHKREERQRGRERGERERQRAERERDREKEGRKTERRDRKSVV